MFRKFLLASILTLGVSVAALADVTMPTVHDSNGQPIGTIPVLTVDSSGNPVGAGISSGQLPPTLGQKTTAGSLSVTLSSDHGGLPAGANALGSVTATGNVADAATDSGNPAKIGGIYESTLPTYTTGQRANTHVGARGGLHVNILAMDGNSGVGASSITNVTIPTSAIGLNTRSIPYLFNGTAWDPQFTCPNSATISVTAAATTQIVALAASQIIRVCSFSVTMSAAGTAQFVYGTGSNCGTGTTSLTAATNLATATPWSLSAPSGGSLFRSASANALCVAAGIGNVVGFVTYAQF